MRGRLIYTIRYGSFMRPVSAGPRGIHRSSSATRVRASLVGALVVASVSVMAAPAPPHDELNPSKLDALSNYHFAPRPIADEAEARPVTVPAIAMEEVLPLHVSDARGVAPEEVFATKRGREGILRGDTEMDQNERKRLRQSKKATRRKARKEKEAGTGN